MADLIRFPSFFVKPYPYEFALTQINLANNSATTYNDIENNLSLNLLSDMEAGYDEIFLSTESFLFHLSGQTGCGKKKHQQ